MPFLMLRELPRFECLLGAAEEYPTLDPTATEAFLNLLRTGDIVFGAESAFLAQHNISQGGFTVLMALNRCCEGPSTPAALADHAGVTRATMTGLLDTLEKEGIVRRGADTQDRRTVLVSLTDAGRSLVERLLPEYFAHVAKLMHPLDGKERKQLVTLLQKIQHGLAVETLDSPAVAAAANA